MNLVAQINSEGTLLSLQTPKQAVMGMKTTLEIQHPTNIFKLWTDDELNAIGYARFNEDSIPNDKVSTGTTNTFSNGQVTRTFTLVDKPEPVVIPDPTPTLPDKDAWVETVPAVMGEEVVEAVLAEDGVTVVTPETTKVITVTPETTINHAATTKPNPEYDYLSLRLRDYPLKEDMIVALWEAVVESRPDANDALETKRQEVKTKFPK